MNKYDITIRQIMDIVMQIEADSEEAAIEKINEGQGVEQSFYLVDEYIDEIEEVVV